MQKRVLPQPNKWQDRYVYGRRMYVRDIDPRNKFLTYNCLPSPSKIKVITPFKITVGSSLHGFEVVHKSLRDESLRIRIKFRIFMHTIHIRNNGGFCRNNVAINFDYK
jgi:hypothetical protein